MRKKKIETNAKVETDQPTTLDEVFGTNNLAKYGTLDEDKYKQELDQLNKSDLEAHARQIGVTIPESVDRLKTNLIRQFRIHVNSLKRPNITASKPIKITKEIEKILAEGR